MLAKFIVNNETYEISGEVSFNTGIFFDYSEDIPSQKKEYRYPKFSNLSAVKIEDEKRDEFHPNGTTWRGRKFTEEDMIASALSSSILGNSDCCLLFLDDSLRKLVEEYKKEYYLLGEHHIPLKMLYVDLYNLYQLYLVTNKYAFYVCEDMYLMYSVSDMSLVSDNYFAEMGLVDSINAVKEGEEKLIFGELPEEEYLI